MDNIKKERQWICVFDLKNCQECYAECMEQIFWLEGISGSGAVHAAVEERPFLPFYISAWQKLESRVSASRLIRLEELLDAQEPKKIKQITSAERLVNGLRQKDAIDRFNFYLRIHMDETENDIVELQYLVLMLQSLPEIKGRTFVRLMGGEGAAWSTKNYFRLSHFLRFIQRRYQCFYACYDEAVTSLQALSQTAEGTQSTFLPLLEVNQELCDALYGTNWKLKIDFREQSYEKLYTAIVPEECDWEFIRALFQIGTRILIANQNGKRLASKGKKEELLTCLHELAEDAGGVKTLDMLLFAALVGNRMSGEIDHDHIKCFLSEVQAISQGVAQILENIVNHSEKGIGVFTFRIQKNQEYLRTHYPRFAFSPEKSCLELMISDSNRTDGIVDNYLNGGKADEALKKDAGTVQLAYMFSDFADDDIKEVWERARSKRPEMCLGLITFAQSIQKQHGAFRVRSSPKYEKGTARELYYCSGNRSANETELFPDGKYVPGTQFSVAINSGALEEEARKNEWGMFDFNRLVYAATYRDLAIALRFEEKVIEFDPAEHKPAAALDFSHQEAKDSMTASWKAWFDGLARIDHGSEKEERRVVYHCDLESFCTQAGASPQMEESFCKGFLSSRFFVEPDELTYYSVILRNPDAAFCRIFSAMLEGTARRASFCADRICVYLYPEKKSWDHLVYYAATMHDLLDKKANEKEFPAVFPYMLFLKNERGQTVFEQELMKQATTNIYARSEQGFKIPDTHMRLGNKVHLDTFYEMAIFFENPNYANYTAFLFLRSFLRDQLHCLTAKKRLLLYGYASYSRAIILATLRILRDFVALSGIKNFPETAFIIYQNDLKLESDLPQIQMYYSEAEWQRNPERIWDPSETSLVLIVPISSSLTTFNKMNDELREETNRDFQALENYTAFWVRNNPGSDIRRATEEEEEFWQTTDPGARTIESAQVPGTIRYLSCVTSTWSNPLECESCFPKDPLMEFPLVETDPTSTIPTQQFYCEPVATPVQKENDEENDLRVVRLQKNMLYGHISKGVAHYQYYVNARGYFQQESESIAQWLRELRMKNQEGSDCINVLIIPQQINNVGFSQYVYEYYFNGQAECITINTEKEYRSNLKAEYSGLFYKLRDYDRNGKEIRFYYVDISIRSGSNFYRAMSLISSCAALNRQISVERVFLLVNRLSEDSKHSYVKDPQNQFHAYTELHISAMRTFGDSCIPCKLQREAQAFHRKAATKSISKYWEKKTYDRECVPFDGVNFSPKQDDLQEDGYRRLICTHRAAFYIQQAHGAGSAVYFRAVRGFLQEILTASEEKTDPAVYRDVNDKNRKEWLAAGLKILARPFFSFDYRLRCVVMDLYLLLAEYMLKGCSSDELHKRIGMEQNRLAKAYILQEDNLEWIVSFAKGLTNAVGDDARRCLEFIRNNILKGLADIRSNYILRKDTILTISKRLGEAYGEDAEGTAAFYEHYLRSILRMTHSSSDETKGVWLECLLQSGEEYSSSAPAEGANGIDRLVGEAPEPIRTPFRTFLELLLVENNRPLYQAVEEIQGKQRSSRKKAENTEVLFDEYRMRNAKRFLSFGGNRGTEKQFVALGGLRNILNTTNEDSNYQNRYHTLGKCLQDIVRLEENVKKDVSVVLYGEKSEKTAQLEKYLKLPGCFVLFPPEFETGRYWIKTPEEDQFETRISKMEEDASQTEFLNENGFYLLEAPDDKGRFDIIIKLDNNYEAVRKDVPRAEIQKIEPMYVYISCALPRLKALCLTRKILMFRRKLIEWLEKDFNNNAIAVLSRQQQIAQILSTDKMGDHAENDFVECQQKLLMAADTHEFRAEMEAGRWNFKSDENGMQRPNDSELPEDAEAPLPTGLPQAREWFFLRSYVNSRVSRLFRTMIKSLNAPDGGGVADIEDYYIRRGQSTMMRPAYDLQTVFFTPVRVGFTRRNYLRQLLLTATLTVENEPDFRKNKNAGEDERLANLEEMLKQYRCVFIEKAGKQYAYLSEYLAVVLLDCIISGIKASDTWNLTAWGGDAFEELLTREASEKCRIELLRERGSSFEGIPFDYLSICNKVCASPRTDKKGPGMSLAAIRWYIEGLWRACFGDGLKYPEVQTEQKEGKYIIRLPILAGGGGLN